MATGKTGGGVPKKKQAKKLGFKDTFGLTTPGPGRSHPKPKQVSPKSIVDPKTGKRKPVK